MSMSDEEIFEKIQEVLEEALGVDDDEVTPEARLGEDLGAESIDYLDISFRLEKAFGIKIGETEMFDQSVLSNDGIVEDGKVTEAGLAALREKMPHADLAAFEQDPQVEKLGDVFTVDMVCKFVKSKLS
ncbi:MAG: acyl carrier protein [Planctomycetota bacterium]